MNKYKRIYNQIIEKYQNTTIDDSVYCEVHHIVPLSLGGPNEKTNLVKLPYRVHVVAHECLYLYYRQIGDKFSAAKMACAVHAMYSHDEFGKRKIFKSRLAEHFKLISNKAKTELLTQKYFEYNGREYSMVELSEISGVNKATLYERLVRLNLLDRYTIDELLVPKLIVKPKVSKEEKQKLGYEKLKPLFDLRYIPDLYKPENNGAALRIKMGEQITIDGVTKAIGEWAREYGLPVGKIRQRLDYGITGKDLLKKEWLNANQVEYGGKTYNGYAELARAYGIDRSTLLGRIKRGMMLDEALSKPVRWKK